MDVAIVPEEREEPEEKPVKRASTRQKRPRAVVHVPEPWTCVICHEEFEEDVAEHMAVKGCKHPLCLTCFETQYNNNRRKCDMCNKMWHIEWVSVTHPQNNDFDEIIMIPLYGRRLAAKESKCVRFQGAGMYADIGTIENLKSPYRETVRTAFPWIYKRRSPEKVLASIRSKNTGSTISVEMFPLSDSEFVILLLRRDDKARLNVTVTNYNAIYLDVQKPREYYKIMRGGDVEVSVNMKAKGKNKTTSLRALGAISEVFTKNNLKTE
jgi:hypothetical protein